MAKARVLDGSRILDQLGVTDAAVEAVADEALEAGAQIAYENFRGELVRSLKGGRGNTGQLLGALGISKARTSRDGKRDVKVGFRDERRDGGINSKIANVLEYGSSRGIAPRGFQARAYRKSRKPVQEAMARVIESRLGGKGGGA